MILAAPRARRALADQSDVQTDHRAALLADHLGAHLVADAGGDEQLDVDVLADAVRKIAICGSARPSGAAGFRRRLDDLDRGDLLVEQEPGHVDLVDQRILTIIALSKFGGHGRVAVRAVHHQRRAQLAGVEHGLELRVFVVEAAHEADLDELACPARLRA